MSIRRTFATICAAAALALPAAAEVKLVTGVDNWTTMIQGGVIGGLNFEESAFSAITGATPVRAYNTAGGVSLNNIQVIGFNTAWSLEVGDLSANPVNFPFHTQYRRVVRMRTTAVSPSQKMQIKFLQDYTAVAFNLSSYQPYVNTIQVWVNGSTTPFNVITAAATLTQVFVGLTATEPIRTIELTSTTANAWTMVDNIQYATAAAAAADLPEPSTMVFSGFGLLGVAVLLRRRGSC